MESPERVVLWVRSRTGKTVLLQDCNSVDEAVGIRHAMTRGDRHEGWTWAIHRKPAGEKRFLKPEIFVS